MFYTYHWTASGGDLVLSASYSATLQLYKVHLLRSPFISDGKRLWIFLHCWAAEAGKGSRSSFRGSVLQVLWKAGCVESSSKRSDRHPHSEHFSTIRSSPLITKATFPQHFSLPVDCSYSSNWGRACYLCLHGKKPPQSPITRSCATSLGLLLRAVLLNTSFPAVCPSLFNLPAATLSCT